jgi:hypothetical protein
MVNVNEMTQEEILAAALKLEARRQKQREYNKRQRLFRTAAQRAKQRAYFKARRVHDKAVMAAAKALFGENLDESPVVEDEDAVDETALETIEVAPAPVPAPVVKQAKVQKALAPRLAPAKAKTQTAQV